MRSLHKGKKCIILLCLGVLVTLRLLYIWKFDKIDRIYCTSVADIDLSEAKKIPCEQITQIIQSDKTRLRAIDVIFTDLIHDEKGKIIICIYHGEKQIWKGALNASNIRDDEWKHIYVNVPLEKNELYKIEITSEGFLKIPNMYITSRSLSSPENMILYDDISCIDNMSLAVRYGYNIAPHIVDKMLYSALWLSFFVFGILALLHADMIISALQKLINWVSNRDGVTYIYIILEVGTGVYLKDNLGIVIQPQTEFVLFVISVICTYHLKDYKSQFNWINKSTKEKIGFLILLLYSTFCISGNRLFVWPISAHFTLAKAILFVLSTVWLYPIIVSSVVLLNNSNKLVIRSHEATLSDFKFIILILFILIVPAALCMYAFNPIISSRDTETCIKAAHSLRHSSDWFPPFYYLTLRFAFEIWDNVMAAAFEQWIFWFYVIIELIVFLRRNRVKDGILISLALFIGLNTSNVLYINTVWKDIPYCCSVLWLSIIISKLYLSSDNAKLGIYIYVELFFAMIGTYFFRKNGIVPFAFTLLLIMILYRKNRRAIISLIASIVMIIMIQYPLYNYLEVERDSTDSMYLGFGQDVIGVYLWGGDLTDSAIDMVTQLTQGDNIEYKYNPTFYNFHRNDLDMSIPRFVKDVGSTFIHNPVSFIKATIAREDLILSIFPGQMSYVNNVNYTETMDYSDVWRDYASVRKDNAFTYVIKKVTDYSVSNQLLNIVIWRCGVYVWIALLSWFIICGSQDGIRKITVVTVIVGQIIGLWISCGWSGEFRYFWPINLLSLLLLFEVPIMRDTVKHIN